MNRGRVVGCLLLASVLAAACGDSGPSEPEDTRTLKAAPSFAADIREIFTRRGCAQAGCHAAPIGGDLDLSSNPHGNLVNTDAAGVAGLLRVKPGDVQNSYLVIKLEGTDPRMAGDRMPSGLPPLDAIDLGNIRNWIANGAPNN